MHHTAAFSKIMTMLNEVTVAMPRFSAYLEVFPTPRLRRALALIYDDYVGFCLFTFRFLNKRPLRKVSPFCILNSI
jgi:hypothetical protein